MAVYMMSADWLKENSTLDLNIDDKTLKMAILEAQEIHIREAIGSGVYDELIGQISASTLTSANQTLMNNYIRPALKYWAIVESIAVNVMKMVNKGLGKRSADNFTPADTGDITMLENRMRDKAEYYTNRLRDYLHENSSTYPLFLSPGSGIDTIHPKGVQTFGGFYLGGGDCEPYGYDGMQ